MNWFDIFVKMAGKKIYIPSSDYDRLETLVDKIVSGYKDWTDEELQLQQNYPEALEVILRKKAS